MSATKRPAMSLALLTLALLGLFPLAQVEILAEATPETSPSLVRVRVKSQQSGLFHEGRLISQSTVIEIGEFGGVVMDAQGYVVAYVGAYWTKLGSTPGQFAVVTSDGRQLPAQLLGFDERLALAVLRVPEVLNEGIVLGTLDNPRAVDLVAWQDDRWHRSSMNVLRVDRPEGLEVEMTGRVQASTSQAPILVGSLLLDEAGRLLGVVSAGGRAGFSPTLNALTVVPADIMRDSVREVMHTGESIRAGWLGITMDAETKEIVVDGVVVNSPAARAGLRRGDIIRELNSKPVASKLDLIRSIRLQRPHSRVSLTVESDHVSRKLEAELVTTPTLNQSPYYWALEVPKVWKSGTAAQPGEKLRLYPVPVSETPNLGMSLDPLTPQLARYFKSPQPHGLLVTSVLEGSVASQVGFQAGDVLLRANDAPLDSLRALDEVLAARRDGNLFIAFVRDGKLQKVRVLVQ